MQFQSIEELQEYVKSIIYGALRSHVTRRAIDLLETMAEINIYGVYEPKRYRRRYSFVNDAAYEIDGINTVGGLNVMIQPWVPFNPGYGTSNDGHALAWLIEYGHGSAGMYDYPVYEDYLQPRPFVHPAYNYLADEYRDLLQIALEIEGLPVK